MGAVPMNRGVPSMLTRVVVAHPSRFSRVLPLRLRHAPLLFTAFAFSTGIALSHFWRPAALLTAATVALLLLAVAALVWAERLAAVAVLLTWLLLGWTVGELRPRPLPDAALLPDTDGLRRDAIARVTALRALPLPTDQRSADPDHPWEQAADREAPTPEQKFTADLQLEQIEELDPERSTMRPLHGTARVVFNAADAAGVECGAVVLATVRLYRPRTFRDPGVWSYSGWLAEQDITATGTVVPRHLHVVRSGAVPFACRMQRARLWATGRLQQFGRWQQVHHLPAALLWSDEDVAAWSAMLFGDRSALTHSLRNSFERTGTFHLFVVSGMHVGLVAVGVFWLMRRLRMHRGLAALCTGAAVTGYALLTGFGLPVQRALLMTLVYLLAESLSRERNALNATGAAVLAMLLLQPEALQESSFQMTVLIALTIAGIAMPLLDRTVAPYARACDRLDILRLDRRLPPHLAQFRVMLRWLVASMRQRFGGWAGSLLLLTVRAGFLLLLATLLALVVELTMSLPMAFYFHRFTWLALPANLLVVPLLAPLMVCGILAFLLCLVAYPVALVAATPAALLLHATTAVVHRLGSLGFDLRTPGPSLPTALGLMVCIGVCVLLLRCITRPLAWMGVVLACGVGCGTAGLERRSAPPHALEIAAIDVGQGDSILLQAPDGQALLIDAGGVVGTEQQARKNTFDTGEEVVSPYLWQRGLRRLDVLVLSHAHMDHLGGMSAVLRNFRPRELWLSVDAVSPLLHELIAQARTQGATVRFLRAGTRLPWHGVQLETLAPDPAYQAGDAPANDDSLVLRATYGKASALLAGDAEQPSEEAMLSAHLLAPVTLLKVGHHGSLTSSGEAFLDAVAPRVAVISCGRDNHFGHPRMPVLARLQQRHVLTARTDLMGAVEYSLHADGSVTTRVPGANQ